MTFLYTFEKGGKENSFSPSKEALLVFVFTIITVWLENIMQLSKLSNQLVGLSRQADK